MTKEQIIDFLFAVARLKNVSNNDMARYFGVHVNNVYTWQAPHYQIRYDNRISDLSVLVGVNLENVMKYQPKINEHNCPKCNILDELFFDAQNPISPMFNQKLKAMTYEKRELFEARKKKIEKKGLSEYVSYLFWSNLETYDEQQFKDLLLVWGKMKEFDLQKPKSDEKVI